MISVIIPANNEARYIAECLNSLLGSAATAAPVQVVVVANGCTDNTVEEAQALADAFTARGWRLDVLDLAEGGKIGALNAGDAAALYDRRVYLDADIRMSADLLPQMTNALDRDEPVYVSGSLSVPQARSFISDRYARFWQRLPFVAENVPGCGIFAVNATARARWGAFPDIISDDTFARFHFTPDEMHKVPAPFQWPITEGFANLVRVRRRQDAGLEQMRRLYPDLAARTPVTSPPTGQKLRLLFRDPVGFFVYASVAIAVRLPVLRNRNGWDRGR